MKLDEERTDAELLRLTPSRPEAFAVFYRRHIRALLGYLLSRTRRAELAADLCAETFAVALEQSARYDEGRAPARAWLFAIANSRLVDAARRGQVESRARQRLGMSVRALTDHDLERVEESVDAGRALNAADLVADLPPEQRQAVLARIVDEQDYAEIATTLQVSEAVVRQRVSRGLGALRTSLGEGKA